MKPETIRQFLDSLGKFRVLTKTRKYLIESALLFILCVLILNYITPQSNILYVLLIFPMLFALALLSFLFLKIIHNPEIGIPIIAFFLPFERIGALTTDSFNIRLSQIFTIITLFAYIGYTYFRKKKEGIQIKKDFSFFILIVFALSNLISLTQSINLARSIDVLFFDLFVFFSYVFISNLLIHKSILEKTILVLLCVSVLVGVYGIFQFVAGAFNLPLGISGLRSGYAISVFGFPRVQATESEPQFWGNFLIIPISLAYTILIAYISRKKHTILSANMSPAFLILTMFSLVISLINLLMTYSRGAWYATAVALGFITIFYIRRFFTIRVLIVACIFFAFAVGGFIFVLNYTKAPITLDTLTGRATQFEDLDRNFTTNEALHSFKAHPLIGIGPGSFGPVEASNPYQKPQAFGEDIGWRIVNNEYLEILAESGLLGLSTFILFALFLCVRIVKALRTQTDTYTKMILVGLTAAFIAMLVQYAAFSTLYVMQVWFLFALLGACTYNTITQSWKNESHNS